LTPKEGGQQVQEDQEAQPPPPPAANGKRSRSGTDKRKKSVPVTTRYDAAELAALDEAASKAGLTRASYQRVQTLSTPPKTRSTRRAPVEREMLALALGQLGRVGNNLNQIARAANIDGAERHNVMATVADLRDLLPLFMEALGRKA
jgi:hypothetical protein